MNALSRFLPTAGTLRTSMWMRRFAATSAHFSRRSLVLMLAGLMIPIGLAQVSAYAQDAPPPPPDQEDQGPPPQQWNALSPDQLNELVAPIALYPDSLVAQILAASTYPSQVADADRFIASQAGAPPDQIAQEANEQPWDPSVKALCAFPSVLSNMDRNLDWTTQLGNAYYNQPQDVMNAVQAMRQQAYARGDLRSSPQLMVNYTPGDIVIEPANPAVVYVPYYDPWLIWGFHPWYRWYAPPPPMGWRVGVHFGFGVGVAIGAWGGWGWGWGHWGFAWGPHPYVAFNHVGYVSRSVTVVNHGYYGHFDRAPGAREYNHQFAHNVYARGYAAGERNGYRGAPGRPGPGYRPAPGREYHPAPNNGYRGAPGGAYRPAPRNESRPGGGYHPAPNNGYHPAPGGGYHPAPAPRNESRPGGGYHPPQGREAPHNEGRPAPHGGGEQHGGSGQHGGGGHGGGDKGHGSKR